RVGMRQFVQSGSAIRKLRLWEFVPYNDARPKVFDQKFVDAAMKLRDQLLAGCPDAERKRRLKASENALRNRPGTRRTRNDISLFLYGGALYLSANKIVFQFFSAAIWVCDTGRERFQRSRGQGPASFT